MIEHIDAVHCIDDILSVEGIDAFFIGPNDLSVSMGLKPVRDNTNNSRFIEAVSKVITSSIKHNVYAGIHIDSPKTVNRRIAQGFQLISYSTEANVLRIATSSAFEDICKERLESKT